MLLLEEWRKKKLRRQQRRRRASRGAMRESTGARPSIKIYVNVYFSANNVMDKVIFAV